MKTLIKNNAYVLMYLVIVTGIVIVNIMIG